MAKQILSVNYEKLPLSNDTIKGMSINPNDQQFLKRLMDRQDEISQEFIKTTYNLNSRFIMNAVKDLVESLRIDLKNINLEVREIKNDIKMLHNIAEENKAGIRNINNEIREIKKAILDHEIRITRLENCINGSPKKD